MYLMHTSQGPIRLHVNPSICLGMTHFPPCEAVTLRTSDVFGSRVTVHGVVGSIQRNGREAGPFESLRGSNRVCQTAFWWSDYRICRTRLDLQQETKNSGCFLPLSSFVMHGTKAERGFKDKVLDTSALLIG